MHFFRNSIATLFNPFFPMRFARPPSPSPAFGAGLLTLLLPLAGLAQGDGMTLVWSDEFDTDGLPDPTKWTYDVGGSGWGNNELQYYTEDRLENARVENGILTIEAIKENYGRSNEYTSARLLSTGDAGSWLYGRVEVRAKLPAGRGTWPAIWMLPTDWVYGGWPDSGEIDIMEHVGYDMQRVHGTVHTEDYNHMLGTQVGTSIIGTNVDTEFHVYALEWRPDRIDVFYDDTLYFTFFNEGTGSATWPFDQRFHLILNIAVGGNWGGAQGVDETIWPQKMEVDYVRVYEIDKLYEVTKHAVPGKIEAETFSAMSGVRVEATVDTGGGQNLGFLNDGDWTEYTLEVAQAGRYAIDLRYASPNGTEGVTIESPGADPLSASLTEATGDWQAWSTATIGEIDLPAGETTLKVTYNLPGDDDINLNWIELRLLDAETYAGYPVMDGSYIVTGDFLGTLDVTEAPWLYSYRLGKWIYLPEELVQTAGAWLYLPSH